ncbi:hypothetical protein [Apibacter adventoris]|uniref:Uncharacterized protein n=1 Tax=Apibacter adventoris TaxID=1679466 RepID=A0A2S8AFI6_9FLAO|nr:hypothetical protein [Apibacter adventoris]PQL94013.1 hypothetical protein C4S76_06475 [Apibacter adventoris]PQL94889.1 hypothetical protein C4S77_02595 [Apibacter adventoris]
MKKIILSIFILAGISFASNAQILIGDDGNTTKAHANLEIVKSKNTDNIPSGILIPRLTVSFLENNEIAKLYGANQNGVLIFVSDSPGNSSITSNITKPGFYYFDATQNKWFSIDANNYGKGNFKPIPVKITLSPGITWNNWKSNTPEGKPYSNYNYFEFQGTVDDTTKIYMPDPSVWPTGATIYIRNNTNGTIGYDNIDPKNFVANTLTNHFEQIPNSATHQLYSDGTRWYLMGGTASDL